MRLVAILDSPAPYTTPILNEVARRLDFHCVYLAGEDRVSRFADSWGVEPRFGHSFSWTRRLDVRSLDLHLDFSLGVSRALARLRPDAVLLVSWKPIVLEPLAWTRWSGSAAVMWAESTKFSGLLRGRVTTAARRRLIGLVDGFVSNGSQASEYLRELGVPSERIVTSALPAGMTPATTKREDGGLDGPRFLFVGRLTRQKRALELIEAFATVRAAVPEATLTIVGAGDLAAEVQDAAARVHGVRYEGHREGPDLAGLYARSDVLVLPAAREVWGVVVNEALMHGLYVIATDEVGSAHDLLRDGSGVMVPAHDLARLAPTMIETARSIDTGDDARERRAAVVRGVTPERFAEDISRAVDLALEVRSGRGRRARRPRR